MNEDKKKVFLTTFGWANVQDTHDDIEDFGNNLWTIRQKALLDRVASAESGRFCSGERRLERQIINFYIKVKP